MTLSAFFQDESGEPSFLTKEQIDLNEYWLKLSPSQKRALNNFLKEMIK